jgi:hypothetical protein
MGSVNVLAHQVHMPPVPASSSCISLSTLEAIRSLPLVNVVESYDVRLRPSGRRLVGRCPLHPDKSPSFYVDPQWQRFHCFGCGASGNVIDFVERMERCDFLEAVNILARRAGVVVERGQVVDDRLTIRAQLREVDHQIERIIRQAQIDASNWLQRLRELERASSLQTLPAWMFGEQRRSDVIYTLLAFGKQSDVVKFLAAAPTEQSQIIDEIFERGYVLDDRGRRWEAPL